DAFWSRWSAAMGARGLTPPASLDRSAAAEAAVEDLYIGQVCGITYVRHLRDHASLIATPCYAAEGCTGPRYCSMIVTSAETSVSNVEGLRGSIAAINSRSSFSGWNALHAATKNGPDFFSSYRETGAHLASAQAVAEGKADCAALDAVCWAMVKKRRPDLAVKLTVIAKSPSVPGLPLIAGPAVSQDEVALIREALFETLDDPQSAPILGSLLITGAQALDPKAYDALQSFDRSC
ncbi:MAG: PhnD/SsuA/transferrin family substrate-binding protein, partial [Pseudomonadota bacterium]